MEPVSLRDLITLIQTFNIAMTMVSIGSTTTLYFGGELKLNVGPEGLNQNQLDHIRTMLAQRAGHNVIPFKTQTVVKKQH